MEDGESFATDNIVEIDVKDSNNEENTTIALRDVEEATNVEINLSTTQDEKTSESNEQISNSPEKIDRIKSKFDAPKRFNLGFLNIFHPINDYLTDILPKAGFYDTSTVYLKKSMLKLGIPYFLGVNIVLTILLLLNIISPSILIGIVILEPWSLLGIILWWPKNKANSRAVNIEDALPLLIVYMGGISTSHASRDELFRYVALRKSDFGEAAKEIARIRILAIDWNLGYIDAAKIVARVTPSLMFNDFLQRFSQALNSGEPLSIFFQKEQIATLNAYMNSYRRSIKSIELVGDAFNAILMALTFIAVTILTLTYVFGFGELTNVLMIILLLISVFLLLAMTMAFGSVSIADSIGVEKAESPEITQINQYLLLFGMLIFIWIVFVITISLPFFIFLIGLGILLYPIARTVKTWEDLVNSRDNYYPVFVRTLGGTTTSIGGSLVSAISYIMMQEFGSLTNNIQQVYARYKFGIDPDIAWDRFTIETNSNLIQKYTRLYVTAISIGGSPQEIGRFVSDNVERTLEMRRDKAQILDSLKGSLIPMIFIVAAILIFMEETLNFLAEILSAVSDVHGGSIPTLGQPPDPLYVGIYFGGLIICLPLFSALAVTLPRQTHLGISTNIMYKVYIGLGVELFVVRLIAKGFLGTFTVI